MAQPWEGEGSVFVVRRNLALTLPRLRRGSLPLPLEAGEGVLDTTFGESHAAKVKIGLPRMPQPL